LQKANDIEFFVRQEGRWALRWCGRGKEVYEATVAAGFYVGNHGLEPVGDKDRAVVGMYRDHAAEGLREGDDSSSVGEDVNPAADTSL
jgi:hypothetical protein